MKKLRKVISRWFRCRPESDEHLVNLEGFDSTDAKISKHSFNWSVDDVVAQDLHNTSFVFTAWNQLDVVCTLVIVNRRSGAGQELRYDLVWNDKKCNPLYFKLSIDVVQNFGEGNLSGSGSGGSGLVGMGGLVGVEKKELDGKHVSSLSTKPSGKILFRASFRKVVVRVDLTLYKNNSLSVYRKLWKFDFASPTSGKSVLSDVALNCGGQSFACHKVVLAACSETFNEMFTGEKAESSEVHIEDLEPEVLELLLKFIYMNQVKEIDVSWKLFEASMAYDIPNLARICIEALKENINVISCSMLLEASYKFDLEKVFKFSLAFLKRNKEEVFKSSGWKKLKQKEPLFDEILKRM